MPKILKLEHHNCLEELEKLYRRASDPVERTRLQIIWLLRKGYRAEEVAKVTGYRRGSIYRIVGRYNQSGADGLKDKRHQHRGGDTLLSETQQALLWVALQEPPPDGGLWNGRKVADWMSNHLECYIHPQRGWEYLRAFEMRLKVPRPAHELQDGSNAILLDEPKQSAFTQCAAGIANLISQYKNRLTTYQLVLILKNAEYL